MFHKYKLKKKHCQYEIKYVFRFFYFQQQIIFQNCDSRRAPNVFQKFRFPAFCPSWLTETFGALYAVRKVKVVPKLHWLHQPHRPFKFLKLLLRVAKCHGEKPNFTPRKARKLQQFWHLKITTNLILENKCWQLYQIRLVYRQKSFT